MIVLSWDVGIVHLAYCVLYYDTFTNKCFICDWNVIDLMNTHCTTIACHQLDKQNNPCKRKVTHCSTNNKNEKLYYCRLHAGCYVPATDALKTITKIKTCQYKKLAGTECLKKAVYRYQSANYCTAHAKNKQQQSRKQAVPQLIAKQSAASCPTIDLQTTLIKRLSALDAHFGHLMIDTIIIENQPAKKNPKMKAIAGTLFDYYLIKGQIERANGLLIDCVKYVSPSNKMKLDDQSIVALKNIKTASEKYKYTKMAAIRYTRQLLTTDNQHLQYLETFKKKDDLCDAYLQARYYIEKSLGIKLT